MPLFGAHMSVAGGLHNAVALAVKHRCRALQIFTKNANQWSARPLADNDVRTFRQALAATEVKFPTAHDSYLINLASPDETLYQRSIEALVDELERAEALGLSYLVMHPGAHLGSGEETGLARVAAALNEIHTRCRGFRTMTLLETTAGQGSTLGHRFEHLERIRSGLKQPERVGVCLDTCHIFAAGYAIGSIAEYEETFQQFDDAIGLSHLKVFHVNDSAKPFDSRVDRHAAIGQGEIGLWVFRRLVNDSRFRDFPMILETPKEGPNGEDMDLVNLKRLRGLVRNRSGRVEQRK